MCQQCGRRFLADGVLANSLLCARCRQASLPQAQSQRELTVTFLGIIFGLTIVMSVVCLPLWTSLVARFGGFAWLVHPLLALGATLGLLAAIFVVMAVFFTLRNWSMRYEKPILALARKVTRQEGTVERVGPVTIWWSGSTDPVPVFTEQMGTVRQRFENLIDERVETPPLRVLVFDERRAFVAYHRTTTADTDLVDSLYTGRPVRSITLSTEAARFRLLDQPRSMRSALLLYFLETYKGFLVPPWLQLGIGNARRPVQEAMFANRSSGE